MIYIWGIVTAACILAIEISYTVSKTWLELWFVIFPCMIFGNFAIFMIIKGSSSLLSAFILYGTLAIIGRVIFSVVIHQSVSGWMWIATTLMVVAMVLRFIGERV